MSIKERIKLPFYTMFHPFQGFEKVKWENKASFISGIVIFIVWIAVMIMERLETGFAYNSFNPAKVSVFEILALSGGFFIAAIVGNWLLCTFMTGEGKFKEIFTVYCFSKIPYILGTIGYVIISIFLPYDMTAFLGMYWIVLSAWEWIILGLGLLIVHQFTFIKTIVNILLTQVAVYMMAFLVLLIYSLFTQLYSFCYTIFNEILFRL